MEQIRTRFDSVQDMKKRPCSWIHYYSNQPLHGFTLVELLVVISIIALLVSILLPSLNKARDAAKFVLCSTNFHQMGLAFLQYAESNNDRIVPGNHPNGVTIQAWFPPIALGPGHLIAGRFIAPPESESHIFYCPATRIDQYHEPPNPSSIPFPRWFENRWGVASGDTHIDIGLEFRDSLDGNWSATGILGEVKLYKGAPADRIGKHALISDWFAHNVTKIQHKGRYNVLFGDASVQIIDDRAYPDGLTGDNPREIGLTNWAISTNYGMGVADIGDSVAYDAIDYIFGTEMWQIPDVNHIGNPPLPSWRQ